MRINLQPLKNYIKYIAIGNGEQWVSDFLQKSFWVAPQYEKEKKYVLYRRIEK